MTVFLDTNYREHDARQLVEYLDKDQGLQNRFGEQMTDEEIDAFIEQSEAYGFEREIIISPEHGHDLSDDQFSLYTRQVMSEFCEGRATATYCYAIHRDTDHPHAHVALTGTKRDLWMDTEDCEQLRERAQAQFHDQHRDLTEELTQQFEQELAHASALDQDPDQSESVSEPERDPTPEPAGDSDHEPGLERDQGPTRGPDT